MENERLLAAINTGTVLPVELESYLGNSSSEKVGRYQRFSLKALKLLVKLLDSSKTPKDQQYNLKLSEIFMSFVGASTITVQNIPPLSFEKLAINLIYQATKSVALQLVKSWSVLVRSRLEPLAPCQQEASALLKSLSNVLWQNFEHGKELKWESVLEIRLLSLEMLCVSCRSSPNTSQESGVGVVKKYSFLISFCLARERVNAAIDAMNALMSNLPASCFQDCECVDLIVEDFVGIKRRAIKQDPDHRIGKMSIKDLLALPSHCSETVSCFLEKELKLYEDIGVKDNNALWKLKTMEELLTIYKVLSFTPQYAYVLIKKASVYHEWKKDKPTQPPLEMVCTAITLLEEMEARSNKEQCMISNILGYGYLWKAICLYSNLVSSQASSSGYTLDSPMAAALVSSVDSWKRLCGCIKAFSIVVGDIKKCFPNFHSTCNHIRHCLSLCSVFFLVPQALWCADALIFLSQWNSLGYSMQEFIPACKSRLVLSAYGERFIDPELELVLKERVDVDGSQQQIEAMLALSLLYCRRGKFSSCNTLLKKVASSPFLSKNSPCAHRLMALLASVSSHYIQAQSEYIPLVDPNTCLAGLSSSSCPICIPCMKKHRGDYKCKCSKDSPEECGRTTGLTELELSLDSLNLTRGLSQMFASGWSVSPVTDASLADVPDVDGGPAAIVIVSSSAAHWDNVFDILSGLHRVAELFFAREAIKDALHYATEGLELAKLMCLRYWCITFLLLLSAIADCTGNSAEGDKRRKEAEGLFQGTEDGELIKRFGGLNLLSNEPNLDGGNEVEFTLNHSESCVCNDCINPVRIVLVLRYLHQLIERRNCPNDSMFNCARHAVEFEWTKACNNLVHVDGRRGKDIKAKAAKPRGKKQKSGMLPSYESEILLPFEIRASSLYVKSLLNQPSEDATKHGQEALDKLNPKVLPLLHIPEIRLSLAELHFVIGQAKLQVADSSILTDIYERTYPMKTFAESSATQVHWKQLQARKIRHRQARKIVDSDEDEDTDDKRPAFDLSSLPKPLLPFITHFLSSYQLLFPATLSLRLSKALYNQLGICLSVSWTNIAAHFILYTSYLSFSMNGVFWTWKKVRRHLKKKNHTAELVLRDISMTISPPGSVGQPASDFFADDLMQSRAILYCLAHPLPLSYTSQLVSQLPEDLVFCNLSLVPRLGPGMGREVIVLVRVSKDKDCVIVKLPLKEEGRSRKDKVNLLQQFRTIMTDCSQVTQLTDKRKWWNARRKLDSQMKVLLQTLEDEWFGEWRFLLSCSGSPLSQSSHKLISSALSDSGVPNADVWAEVLLKGHCALEGKDDLRSVLKSLSNGHISVLTVDKIYKELMNSESSSTAPLVLSLGHPLHELPLESMPLLRNHPVSRIPSLPFLVAHSVIQSNRKYTHIDPRLTYYIINPSGDLKNTEKTFAKWFENEEGWEGVVGSPPTSAQFVYGFEEKCVLIYCGHGKAREYLKGGHIQELDCQATVLQMGCSSGKLQNSGGDLEPNGIVFNFLLAGCPSLVVNLWDVTDVDIDRFCTALVKEWLSGTVKTDHYKLLQIVSEARESCKLKYLVGASPVVYGLPVLGQ